MSDITIKFITKPISLLIKCSVAILRKLLGFGCIDYECCFIAVLFFSMSDFCQLG